jgi:hypothetical protein
MDIQLQQQQTTTQRTVSADVDGVHYVVTLIERDGQIDYACASVNTQQEVQRADGQSVITMSYQGTIIYEDGVVRTQHIALNDTSQYIDGFTQVLAAIEQ